MAREPYFKNWKNIFVISYGLVVSLFFLFLIFNTGKFFPGKEDMFFKIFLSYGLLFSIVYGNTDTRNRLFNIQLRQFAPRFVLFFIGFLLFFYLILSYFDPLKGSLFGLLSQIPIWLLVVHAFVFATIESAFWQGFLDERIGHPWSEISAGVFHMFVWSGNVFIILIGATFLFAFFSFVHWYFRRNKNDLSAVIGCHTAYNYVKLAMVV